MRNTRPNWYLTDVKEKENRTWTEEEQIDIFTLRQKRVPANEVALKYNATITQIYNITRLVKKGFKKCCYKCNRPLTENELSSNKKIIKLCTKCKKETLEYKRSRREQALKEGKCGYCETRPVVPGHTGCKKCLSATHRRRNKTGLCGICGRNPVAHTGGALCKDCITICSIITNIRRQKE